MEFAKTKKVKFGGVAYKIRQLSPTYFMDQDNILPINNILEKSDKKNNIEKKIEENKHELKNSIKNVLLIGVIEIRRFLSKESIDKVIDKIMLNPDLYSYLFISIISYSLGLKKKHFSQFI